MTGLKRKMDRGVTLIELMIVMVIAAILVGGIYTLFISQQRSYSVQDQVVGIQQDARAALTIMAREIRLTGFLTGSTGFDINPGAVSFTTAVTPQNSNAAPDQITIVYAEQIVPGGAVTNVAGNAVTLPAGQVSALNIDAGNNRFIAFEGESPHVYQIFSTSGDQVSLTDPPGLGDALGGIGANAYLVQAITYRVQTGVLQRINENDIVGGTQPLAGDGTTTVVEDLQVAYQVAGSNDWIFDVDTLVWPGGATNADIRMVRISVVVRNNVPDPEGATFNQPPLEDHVGGLSGPDGFRRRVYTTVVKLRNVDL